jgi:transcriptional regulator with XRE-family HTH domain
MEIQAIRSQRVAAEIPAILLARHAGIDRSRLSLIERGHVQATNEELRRLDSALNLLIAARLRVREVAERVGWPVAT